MYIRLARIFILDHAERQCGTISVRLEATDEENSDELPDELLTFNHDFLLSRFTVDLRSLIVSGVNKTKMGV